MISKTLVREISAEARSVYDLFSRKKYAEHIATPVSIEALLRIIKRVNPKNILEIGGGIGTLTYAIAQNSDAHVDVFEDLPFCIEAFKENLKGFENRYTLVTSYDGFQAPRKSYDLIIVDGGPNDFLVRMVNGLNDIAVIYTDGHRHEPQRVMRRELRKRYIFKLREYVDAEAKFKGGFSTICRPSKNVIARAVSYYACEAMLYLRAKMRNIKKRFGF